MLRTITRPFTLRLLAVVGTALLATGCEHLPGEPGSLASITVVRNPDTLVVNTAHQFAAIGRDANGTVVGITPTWSVAAGGGTVNANGVFAAGATTGTFANTVKASVGSLSGSATVTVVIGAVPTVVVSPSSASMTALANQTYTAVVRDGNGVIVAIPPVWSVVAGGGTINPSTGVFTAGSTLGAFPNTVQATAGGVSGYASAIVFSGPGNGQTLGSAATYGILAGTAVTCASAPGTINADAGVWPGSSFSGFPPCVITGTRHAADVPAQTAQTDLTTAYLALAALPCGTTITANLGGTTLAPGVYCSATTVGVTGVVTLNGTATDVFVIRAASSLTTAGSVVLSGGAQAKNVYWFAGSSATLGTGSAWQGNILALTSITLVDNASLVGRALARNGGVSLGTNNVITLP